MGNYRVYGQIELPMGVLPLLGRNADLPQINLNWHQLDALHCPSDLPPEDSAIARDSLSITF